MLVSCLSPFIRLNGLLKGDEHPAYTLLYMEYGALLSYLPSRNKTVKPTALVYRSWQLTVPKACERKWKSIKTNSFLISSITEREYTGSNGSSWQTHRGDLKQKDQLIAYFTAQQTMIRNEIQNNKEVRLSGNWRFANTRLPIVRFNKRKHR